MVFSDMINTMNVKLVDLQFKVGVKPVHPARYLVPCHFKGRQENSVQRIVVFPANRNRNRFAEPNSVQIGIGIVCEF